MPPGDRWQTAHSSMFNGGFGGKRDTSSDSKRVGNKQQETATSSDNFAGAPHPSMDTMGDADDYYLADYAKTFSFQSSHPPSHHNYLPRSSRRFDPTNYQTHIQASQDLAASTGDNEFSVFTTTKFTELEISQAYFPGDGLDQASNVNDGVARI
ncbi:hypothetical protein sscle_14g100210 [Sclerotinia sclerotiorum 1980 UF-70]|uniref:Uncharacterized protein n=1 Tax=Sclerotinia sclerotiorum (strain ATCC 18683 / 1980 / Ss-1) TaxID=665079 RepID=A0A1D9QK32_SCLS1|nr:hypothetical protein sscle_14g100210 [Sclerotinia sclerotiorum 1980 UF-70]